MKLHDALQVSGCASKHSEGGTYTFCKAKLSPGYYKDFQPDGPGQGGPSTSVYFGYDYPRANPLEAMIAIAGEDGWESF